MELMSSIIWRAREFEQKEKPLTWFLGLGAMLMCLIVLGLLTGNYFFAVLVVLIGFVLVQYARKEPRTHTFTIDDSGLMIDARRYQFESFSSFWIFYEPPQLKELSFRSKQRLMPYMRIPLASQDPVVIRRALIAHLPERKHRQWFFDEFVDRLGF
jgi:hypothetical protein